MPVPVYLRTETPQKLTSSFEVPFSSSLLDQLNICREARHAYLTADKNSPDLEGLRVARANAAVELLEMLSGYVDVLHGQGDDWAVTMDSPQA